MCLLSIEKKKKLGRAAELGTPQAGDNLSSQVISWSIRSLVDLALIFLYRYMYTDTERVQKTSHTAHENILTANKKKFKAQPNCHLGRQFISWKYHPSYIVEVGNPRT